MSIKLYMDVHVPIAITKGLRERGIDVLTSQEDRTTRFSDPKLLNRATTLGRVLFTQDSDLLAEASDRLLEGREFAGVIYARQRRVTVGRCIDDLELICQASEPEELYNKVEHLPLK